MRLFLGFLLLFFLSCSSDSDDGEVVTSSPYVPLAMGHTLDYEMTEYTFLNEGELIDTSEYQLREEIVDIRINAEGEEEYIIDRSRRSNSTDEWVYQESHRSRITDNQAIRIEGNLPFVKFQFPTEVGDSWSGTSLFDANTRITIGGQEIEYFKDWNSRYLSLSDTYQSEAGNFEDVITIEVANQVNRLELRQVNEQYAPSVGLISRDISILDTQCFSNCESIPWKDKASKGHILSQKIIAIK